MKRFLIQLTVIVFVIILAGTMPLKAQWNYVVGDVNGSGDYNGLDIVYGVAFFKGVGPAPVGLINCPPHPQWYVTGDVNSHQVPGDPNNCKYNGLDITYGISYLKGGQPVRLPCPDCPGIQ